MRVPKVLEYCLHSICKFAFVKILRGSISIALVFAVLLSGMGFTVSQHYCLGHLQSEQFFGEAEACFMESSCEAESDLSFQNQDCCEDVRLSIEGLSFEVPVAKLKLLDLPLQFFDLSLSNPNFSLANFSRPKTSSGNDPPRLIKTSRSILIAVQRFLI